VRSRLLAAAPLAAALLLYLVVALPLRSRTLALSDQYRDARRERQDAQSRLGPLLRREAALREASVVFAGPGAGGAVAAVRRSVLAMLEGTPVRGVALAVRPARSPAAATVEVRVSGRYADVVRLSGDLVRPGTGLVLERAQLAPRADGLELELRALALEGRR